jgi:hypothetical protein
VKVFDVRGIKAPNDRERQLFQKLNEHTIASEQLVAPGSLQLVEKISSIFKHKLTSGAGSLLGSIGGSRVGTGRCWCRDRFRLRIDTGDLLVVRSWLDFLQIVRVGRRLGAALVNLSAGREIGEMLQLLLKYAEIFVQITDAQIFLLVATHSVLTA